MLKLFDPDASEYDDESPVFVLTRRHVKEFLEAQDEPQLAESEWDDVSFELWERDYEYFGENKALVEIMQGDADDWRRWLSAKMGENTVRRHCGRAKQFFRAAARKKLISESPFADMKDCKVNGNRERDYFVTLNEAQKVLDTCPDA